VGAVAVLGIGQSVPAIRTLLGTAPIGFVDHLVCAGAAGIGLLANELCKRPFSPPALEATPALAAPSDLAPAYAIM
jgi:hypothetical protein